MNSTKDQRPNCLTIKILSLILASDDAEICDIAAAEGKNTFHVNILFKGPVIIYVGGGEGGKSWGQPGLFYLDKRAGPKEIFTMIGGGSLCVL